MVDNYIMSSQHVYLLQSYYHIDLYLMKHTPHRTAIFLLIMMNAVHTDAQNTYAINWNREGIILGSSASLFAGGGI